MTEAEKQAAEAAAAKEAEAVEAKAKANAEAKAAEEAKGKETIGQVLEPKESKPEQKVVPEAAFLEMKKDNKELRKEISELRKLIEDGGTKAEISASIAEIGDRFGVDKNFLGELSAVIRKDIEKDTDEKLKPLTAKEREQRIENIFGQHFDKAMGEMPEFANVVNRDVIKKLSLLPENANKTFPQLIEETYGKALPGKRTLEASTPGGGKSPETIDFERVKKDSKYLDEILKNPETRKQYNEGLTDRLGEHL